MPFSTEEEMMRTLVRAATTLAGMVLGSTLLVFGSAGPALAHEERNVGTYTFAVGFGDEPAYAGSKNSVQLILSKGGKAVTALGDSLKVEVTFGTQTMDLPIEPDFEIGEFGTPGDYRAWFFPTRPGSYTFHFTGSIGSQQVDEEFTSSSTTFSDVVDPTSVEFPVKDPTLGQVAQRLDREFPRIETQLASTRKAADDGASSAKTLGYVGIGLGAIGLIVAIVALTATRRRGSTA
jgi:hypothetical protein